MLSPFVVLPCFRPIKMIENIVIRQPLDIPFSVHPLHNNSRTENEVQPTRPPPNLISHHKTKTEQHTRHFCIFQCDEAD